LEEGELEAAMLMLWNYFAIGFITGHQSLLHGKSGARAYIKKDRIVWMENVARVYAERLRMEAFHSSPSTTPRYWAKDPTLSGEK